MHRILFYPNKQNKSKNIRVFIDSEYFCFKILTSFLKTELKIEFSIIISGYNKIFNFLIKVNWNSCSKS